MAPHEAYELELRAERDELLSAFAAVDGVTAVHDFQLRLAAAIEAHEPDAFKLKKKEAKEHLRLLRLLGDGLAWEFLHPYAIRQLAKNPAPPPALTNQGSGFDETLEAARQLASAGYLVLVSDLSHCLTIGDLVICNDRERPSIIECGGHEAFLHKGRKARQLKRARAVIDLLRDGTAVFPGNVLPTQTLELTTPPNDNWKVVDRVVQAAESQGSAWEFAGDDDLVFALSVDADTEELKATFELANHMAQPAVAVYTRLLERPDPRVPPCTAWDLSLEAKRLLYQGDVSLCHVIDVTAFTGRRSGNAEIVKVLSSGKEITGFGVVVGDDRLTFSHEFLTDVLLGFSTIESTTEAILEGARATLDLADCEQSGDRERDWECDRVMGLADEDGLIDVPVDLNDLNRLSATAAARN